MTAPVLQLPVKFLRSATAGRRPGDGTFRALTDGDFFVNTYDKIACYLNAAGGMVTMPFDTTLLAPLASPALTGTPTAPTPAAGDSSTKLANTAFVSAAVTAILNQIEGGAPAALSTLKELADAIADNPSYAAATASALAQRLRLDAAGSYTAAQQQQGLANLGIGNALADGCCRLSVSSATGLLLSPYNGTQINIGGTYYTIPSAGIPYAINATAANTTYYVYAVWNGAAIVLYLTGSAYTVDGSGRAVLTGNLAYRLVGMVRTDLSGQLSTALCLNWFNRRRLTQAVSWGNLGTSSTSPVALTSPAGILCWGDETIDGAVTGIITNAGAGYVSYAWIQYDTGYYFEVGYTATIAGAYGALCMAGSLQLGEGYHTFAVVGEASGNTANYYAVYGTFTTRG